MRPKKNDNNNHQIKRHFYFLLFSLFFLFVFVNIFPLTNWKWVTFCGFRINSLTPVCKMLYLFVITPFAIVYVGCFFLSLSFSLAIYCVTVQVKQINHETNKENPMNRTMDSHFNLTVEHLKCFTCNSLFFVLFLW